MIRRPPTGARLGLDSLTDTMTNMMGLILLMVVSSTIVSGGMRLTLHKELTDPGGRAAVYLVCTEDQVLLMHKGDAWEDDVRVISKDLQGRLGRSPETSDVLREANLVGLSQPSDLHPMFVREESTDDTGKAIYIIGIRFLLEEETLDAPEGSDPPDGSPPLEIEAEAVLSPYAAEAIAQADPGSDYVFALVLEDGFDTLRILRNEAKAQGLSLGWRPVLRQDSLGLSESGLPGSIGE